VSSNPSVERRAFSTTSMDEAYGFLKEMYVDHSPAYAPAKNDFRLEVSSGTADDIAGSRVRATMHYGGQTEQADKILMGVLAEGRIDYRSRREECACGAGDAFVMSYDERTEAMVSDPDVTTLQVPLERIVQAAQANYGPLQEPLEFYSIQPISPAMNRLFAETVHMVTAQLLSPEGRAFEQPLIARQLMDVAVSALLNGFANSTMTADYRQEPRKVGPAAARRAVAHIDEHAAEPISLSDVAEATGVGARELHATFTEDHGMTPMEYLRTVRLEGAHRDLQARSPGGGDTVATVAAIAYRWGFANPRLFAALYRATHGRAPGVTLGEDPA
jgi:AraC-like DNA-binding protein